jgi:hypothetical protein
MDPWSISRSFVIFYGHLVQFVIIWYIFSCFGILYQEKSGNPGGPGRSSEKKLPKVPFYRFGALAEPVSVM